jgi:isoleucyl-tRNA synthetase
MRSPLDRWILSRVSRVAEEFHDNFNSWEFHKAGRALENFVVNDLSNWYVRRSRRRLWDEVDSSDKRACQHTLHEILLIVCRLMSPISPFMADKIHRDISGVSVHLSDWPAGSSLVERNLPPQDYGLEQQMLLVRNLAEAGRRIRVEAERRQRLPCRYGWIIGAPDISNFHEILSEELNVEFLSTESDIDKFQKIALVPNRKILGAKCRSDLPAVLAQLETADPDSLLLEIEADIAALAGYHITMDDIEVKRIEKDDFAASTLSDEAFGNVTLILDMNTDAELLSKGLARDIIRRIQSKRKDMNLEVEAMINLSVWIQGLSLNNDDWQHIQNETRAGFAKLNEGEIPSDENSFSIDNITVFFNITS